MLVKAVQPYPLDVGGRLMAAGESADLEESAVVLAHLASGDLVPVAVPDSPKAAPKARERKEPLA